MAFFNMIEQMLKGSLLTIEVFFITLIISMPLGLCITFMYTGRYFILRKIMGLFIMIMRGTPLLLQMFFFYFFLPMLPFVGRFMILNRLSACLIAFILNYAAYYAEIFRGGLLAVDNGQYEAAQVLGISKFTTTTRIVIPQMIKVVLPAVSNEAIILIKDTALISALAQQDLLQVTRSIVNAQANVMPFLVAGVFYLVMSYLLSLVFKKLEKVFMF